MNEMAREPRKTRPTTQAADGVPRMRWTLTEFERLIEVGILTEEDRVELIQGELVPMASKGNRHELLLRRNHGLDDPASARGFVGFRPRSAGCSTNADNCAASPTS